MPSQSARPTEGHDKFIQPAATGRRRHLQNTASTTPSPHTTHPCGTTTATSCLRPPSSAATSSQARCTPEVPSCSTTTSSYVIMSTPPSAVGSRATWTGRRCTTST
eukprot:Rmarinus@m.1493